MPDSSRRSRRKRKKSILPIALVALLIAGLSWVTFMATRDNSSAEAQSSINVLNAGTGCDKEAVFEKAMFAQGFKASEFVVGADQVNWSAAEANERGSAAFTSETLVTAEELVGQLSASDAQAKAAIKTLMEESNASLEELVEPKNWTAVQFKVDSAWDGNTAFRGGKAVSAGTRNSAQGDVVWLFVQPDKCKQATAGKVRPVDVVIAHRAGCGNPQRKLPRPVRPKPTTPPTTGEQGKDHRLAPWSPTVIHCPEGQILDRYTEKCIPVTSPTTAPRASSEPPGRQDSGDGATNTTTPPTTTAPPPAPPTTTPPVTAPPPPTIPSF